eukprot:505982_1
MTPYKPQPITHITVERVYKNGNQLQVTNPSVIGSDKASTMSSARKDKFIRRKNLKITHRTINGHRTNSYKMIKMQDIDEDSEENYNININENITQNINITENQIEEEHQQQQQQQQQQEEEEKE